MGSKGDDRLPSASPARPLLRPKHGKGGLQPTAKGLSRPPASEGQDLAQRAIDEGLVCYLQPPQPEDGQEALDEEEDYNEYLLALAEWRSHRPLPEELLEQVLHQPTWWPEAVRAGFTYAVACMVTQQTGTTPAWPELKDRGGGTAPLSEKQVALGSQLFRIYDSMSAAQRGFVRTLWSDSLRNTRRGGDWPGFGEDPTKAADFAMAEDSPSVRGFQLAGNARRPPEPRQPPPGFAPLGGAPRFHQRGGSRAPVGSRALSLASGSAAGSTSRIPAWKGKGRGRLALSPAPKRMPGRGRGSAASSGGDPASAGERGDERGEQSRKRKQTRRAGHAITAKRHRKRARLAEEERAAAEAADDYREGEDSASEASPSVQDE